MSKQYVVTGACITHVPAAGPDGPLLVTLYQGAPLPEGVPADRVKHLLDNNLIEEVGGSPRNAEPKQQAPRGRKPAESKPADKPAE